MASWAWDSSAVRTRSALATRESSWDQWWSCPSTWWGRVNATAHMRSPPTVQAGPDGWREGDQRPKLFLVDLAIRRERESSVDCHEPLGPLVGREPLAGNLLEPRRVHGAAVRGDDERDHGLA